MRSATAAGLLSRRARMRVVMSYARHLTVAEASRLLTALLLLLEIDARLRLRGLARLQEALRLPLGVAEGAKQNKALPAEVQPMVRAIGQVSARFPGARCLHRSFALILWLRRRGLAAHLRIGVRRTGETISGHAWVQWDGMPLNEQEGICDSYELLEHYKQRSAGHTLSFGARDQGGTG